MKKALLIVAHNNFQSIEYGAAKKVLQAAGIQVATASNLFGPAVSSSNEQVLVDVVLENVSVADYDGVFFIGGAGALENLNNEQSYRVIREAASSGKIWGAICISPRILAAAGVLKNKKVTGWDGDGQLAGILVKAGVEYVRESVVADGNLITGNGPEAAEEWGKRIIKAILS